MVAHPVHACKRIDSPTVHHVTPSAHPLFFLSARVKRMFGQIVTFIWNLCAFVVQIHFYTTPSVTGIYFCGVFSCIIQCTMGNRAIAAA